jgi:hypothetical protein
MVDVIINGEIQEKEQPKKKRGRPVGSLGKKNLAKIAVVKE